ncbi:BACON domain-containing protein, partial [Streptomyces triticirhizae]|uniref:BACON domain-containing protein n=1 Tax=Streptomyces triticirhizae TaxID=2483353 RepID=UPI003899CA44
RWDRLGFPVPERDRAARRERLRGRAVTGTVVATVLAAPVLALWAAYRGAPVTGEAAELEGMSASAPDEPVDDEGGGARRQPNGERDPSLPALPEGPTEDETADRRGREPTAESSPEREEGAEAEPDEPTTPAPGELSVDAVTTDSGTLLTLTVSGGSPVSWTATADVDWLLLGRSSGTLWPGETLVIEVLVDTARQPAGPWSASVTVEPTGTRVTVEGAGGDPGGEEPPEDPAEPPTEEPAEPPTDEPVPQPRPV